MPASTLLHHLHAQFRSENIVGTIPSKQVEILPQIALEAQRICTIDISCSVQWMQSIGMILDMSDFTV